MVARVKVRDVISRVNTKVDKDHTDLIYYVGGEHFDSECVRVSKRGLIAGSTIGPMFYYGFKAGDFLLVSRNPHLKKAGIVDFDGICSEKTFVLASSNPEVLLPEFLPFILQNDTFWDYAYQNRHGSTNTFINWSTLADYEFELPDLNIQKRLADVLWSMEEVSTSYKELITATDDLVKSQFIEMFNGDNYPLVPVKEVLNQQTTVERIDNTLVEKYVTVALYGKGVRERSIEKYDPKPFSAYRVKAGQFIYSRIDARNGAFGIIPEELDGAVVSKDFPVFDIDLCRITPEYLIYCVLDNGFMQQIRINSIGTTNRQRVNEEALLSYKIKLPSVDEQNRFIGFIHQTDKSKHELKRALSELTATYKSIIAENLS